MKPYLAILDEREPVYTWEMDGRQVGFFVPDYPTLLDLTAWSIAQIVVAAVFAVCIHYTLEQRRGSSLADLTMWGVWMPFWVFAPTYVFVDLLGVVNTFYRFCLCVMTPTLAVFRLTELYFGFAPKHATSSAFGYAIYFAAPMVLRFNKGEGEYVKATPRTILAHLQTFLLMQVICGGFFSVIFLYPDHTIRLGQVSPDAMAGRYQWELVGDLSTMRASFLGGLLLQVVLTTFIQCPMFFTSVITGIQVEPIMDNPMFASTSPSDFWGRRWNRLIHGALKNGVYKPSRAAGFSHAVSVAITFVASGLFHEWLLGSTFGDAYPYLHGGAMGFFLWQAGLVALESFFSKRKDENPSSQRSVVSFLPGPLRTVLVILAGLPTAHWFLDPYLGSQLFVMTTTILPVVRPTIQS